MSKRTNTSEEPLAPVIVVVVNYSLLKMEAAISSEVLVNIYIHGVNSKIAVFIFTAVRM
jgi:hypothetical protein